MTVMQESKRQRRSLRCLTGWHKFEKRHNADAGAGTPFYYQCAQCGKHRDVPQLPWMSQ